MNLIPSIADAFQQVVSDTSAAIAADTSIDWGTLPKVVYFLHGNPREIVKVLQEYTNSPAKKDKKYPLIALMRDIKEGLSNQSTGIGTKFSCKILIINLTKPEYRSTEREIKSFKRILHPILSEFINQLGQCAQFYCPTVDEMEIVKYDRYFWGTVEVDKNILNDFVDAVELEINNLKLKNNNCPMGITI